MRPDVLRIIYRHNKVLTMLLKDARYSLHCMSFGVPLRLQAGRHDLLQVLPDLLPFSTSIDTIEVPGAQNFLLLPPSEGRGYRSYVGDEMTLESGDVAPVLEQFARDLILYVADRSPDLIFVHAGVVEWGGHVLVLPGTSFAGKTTLTAALVRAGATYYSDEYAVVDAYGWVHPYARDLQVRSPGEAAQRNMPIGQLRGQAGTSPLRVAQVVFTRYQAGGRWMPEPVTPGMAVLEMLRHTIPVRRSPQRVLSTLTAMMERATAWSSVRGEADDVVRMMLHSLDVASHVESEPASLGGMR
jgi:hypothetical protein